MDYSKIIIEPGKLGGKPCIRGMRMTEGEILNDFPDLPRDDIPLPGLCRGP